MYNFLNITRSLCTMEMVCPNVCYGDLYYIKVYLLGGTSDTVAQFKSIFLMLQFPNSFVSKESIYKTYDQNILLIQTLDGIIMVVCR